MSQNVFSFHKLVSIIMIMIFGNLVIAVHPACSVMVNTAEVFQRENCNLEKQKLLTFLKRQDVQHKLQSWGVDPDMAKARISSLTDQELSRISNKMGELPAGGSALGTVVGAAIFIFVVLLITDILGYTSVFTFVNR